MVKKLGFRKKPAEKYQPASEPAPVEHSTADYANYSPPKKQRFKRPELSAPAVPRRLVKVIIAAFLIGALILAAYQIFGKSDNTKKQSSQGNTSRSQSTQLPTTITSETAHHDSSNLNLGFDYPKDWTVKDDGNGIITVTSPAMQLKASTGSNEPGQIVMTIRNKEQKLSEFDAGPATAVLISEKMNYSKPTQTQRGTTYLSFLNFFGNNVGLDGIYITGDNGYKVDQLAPGTDFKAVDPVVNVTFLHCANGNCSAATENLTLQVDVWKDTNFSQPIKSMLQSLSFN